ncbi:MAG: EutN/CcmL family microcompartment protein [Acidobacteria bacterium]|nr:EutN/CcmL family microcompartment protein [Acidobacteriota bacterium]
MQLARVRGHVVASRKLEQLRGRKLPLLQAVDEADRPLGELFIAVDLVSARPGDRVLFVDAREAPKALPDGYGAIDACVVGLVDSAE